MSNVQTPIKISNYLRRWLGWVWVVKPPSGENNKGNEEQLEFRTCYPKGCAGSSIEVQAEPLPCETLFGVKDVFQTQRFSRRSLN